MPDPMNYGVIIQELVRRSNEDSRRLRGLEQRLDSIENKINVFEDSMIEKTKKINGKFAELDLALKTLTDELTKLNSNLDKINKQTPKFARKQDLKEIEHMLNLLSPIRQIADREFENELSR